MHGPQTPATACSFPHGLSNRCRCCLLALSWRTASTRCLPGLLTTSPTGRHRAVAAGAHVIPPRLPAGSLLWPVLRDWPLLPARSGPQLWLACEISSCFHVSVLSQGCTCAGGSAQHTPSQICVQARLEQGSRTGQEPHAPRGGRRDTRKAAEPAGSPRGTVSGHPVPSSAVFLLSSP